MPGFAETFGYMLLALACLASAAGLYWAWHTLEVPPQQNKARKARWSDWQPACSWAWEQSRASGP